MKMRAESTNQTTQKMDNQPPEARERHGADSPLQS